MDFTGERYVPNLDSAEISYEHWHRYLYATQFVEGKVVLDIASGEGYGSDLLAKTATRVVGVDISQVAVNHASKTYKKDNLEFLVGSVTDIPVDGESIFDVIISFEIIEHVSEDDQKKFLQEVKRLLKPDGVFICSTPDKKAYSDVPKYKNEFHIKEFYEEEFKDFLSEYFKSVNVSGQKIWTASYIWNKNSNNLNFKEFEVEHKDGFFFPSNKQKDLLYMVAICSDHMVEDDHFSILTDLSGEILHSKDKLISKLTEELEEKTVWAKNLDKEVERHKILYKELKIEFEDRTKWALSLDQEIKLRDTEINIFKDKEQDLAKLTAILKDKEKELASFRNELQFRDEELLALKRSYSYRIGRLFVVPVACTIDLFRKAWFSFIISLNFFKHPINFIKKFSFSNVRRFFFALKTESLSSVVENGKKYFSKSAENFSPDISNFKLFPAKNYNKKIIFEKFDSPLVSIIVPVYNQWNYTYSCFLSILENTQGIRYEVILADDVSSDETKDISKYAENVIVCRNEKNLGFLRNCKNAAKHAKGKYLLFLNNDTNVQSGWLDSMLDIFNKDMKAGMLGSKLVYPDGRLQEAGGIIWKDGTGWNYGKLDDPEKPEYNYVKEVDYISGASIMIRTDLWKEIGGFDERYERAYFEDSDLAFEVRKHGYKVIYQPKSVVVHFEGISNGTSEQSGEKSYQKKNRETFIKKWKLILENEHFNPGENVFLARDKSKNKKTILVIDHYVPHFDKDAGSRTSFQYLKLFVNMGLNVKFIGDNFYKHEPYTSTLEQLGIEVLYGAEYSKNWGSWIEQSSEYIDYVYLNRPHIAMKYIDFIKKNTKAKILYYGHDLHYLRETRRYKFEGDKTILKSIEIWKNMEFEIFKKADVIYYPSKTEVEIIKKNFPQVNVSEVPAYVYEDFLQDFKYDYSKRHDLLFVGSFNHLPNIDGLMWFIEKIFPKVLAVNSTMKLYVVGSNPPEKLMKANYKNVVMCGCLSDKELSDMYNKVRLVVVPLRYGAGLKGKVIEAMYRSVPVISTTVGAEGIYEATKIMKICDTVEDFTSEIIEIYDNFDLLNDYSINSLNYIKNRFSIDAAKSILENEITLKN